jgi:hypothetical protein
LIWFTSNIFIALAQSDPRFSISAGLGPSFPIGVFGKRDMANAIRLTAPTGQIMGIAKSESGFAKTGYYYSISLHDRLFKKISAFIRTGQSQYQVSTTEMDANLFVNYTMIMRSVPGRDAAPPL